MHDGSSEPVPDVAGAEDGSIGFEWWNGKARLFMDFEPSGLVRLYVRNDDGRQERAICLVRDDAGPSQEIADTFNEFWGALMQGGDAGTDDGGPKGEQE